MKNETASAWTHGLIWFGAAVSIAEIVTGSLLAPLGFSRGLLAIVAGHLIGAVLFYFAGLIGSLTGRSSMGSVKISFGEKGSRFFSSLNVLQLVGWTAVMLMVGSQAAQVLLPLPYAWLWSLLMGAMIALWLALGFKEFTRLNSLVMFALFALTVWLSLHVFRGGTALPAPQDMAFGRALELSAVMPLSWLPLVSDYTRRSGRGSRIPLLSALVYFLASCWMYIIGLGAALFAGESDFAQILHKAGPGSAGLLIVILSTVTTTFLDVYSGGVSLGALSRRLPEKASAFSVCFLGTLLALFAPMSEYENFLYLIGSVFAPMIAVQIVDTLILKRRALRKGELAEGRRDAPYELPNLLAWLLGFMLYRYLISLDLPVGSTLPVMFCSALAAWLLNRFMLRTRLPSRSSEEASYAE